MPKKIVIIPFYNESDRISKDEIQILCMDKDCGLLFVNDGSTDDTLEKLNILSENNPEQIQVLNLEQNQGKAEAVRLGLLKSVEMHADVVGYADADFATPAVELKRLYEIFERTNVHVVMGSRVKLLGLNIKRKALRHYLGRVFATFASLVLNLPVYDTQCGAKFFKNTPHLKFVLQQPFISRWAFDVELIGRLIKCDDMNSCLKESDFAEIPLRKWEDIGGSKIGFLNMINMGLDLFKIFLNFRKAKP